MNKIWQIIRTEFKIEFAYPLTWVFFLVLPIVFTLAIGVALGGSQQIDAGSEPVDDRPFLILIDNDQSTLSEKFLSYLEHSDVARTSRLAPDQELPDESRQTADAFLTVPVGYEQALLTAGSCVLTLDVASESFTSIALENTIRSAINHTSAALMASQVSQAVQEGEDIPAGQFEQAQIMLEEQPLFQLEVHTQETQDEPSVGMVGFNQSSSGQLVTWSLITLLGGSIVFVRDRKDGTYQRMFTTPTTKFIYFIGKILSRLLMGLLQMILLVFFGMYVLNVQWGDDPLLLLGFLTCFSLAGTSLGLMIGAFTKSVKQADNITTLVSMAMSALGGAWWPLEITPASYQAIVRGLPSTWAMLGFNDIIIKGQGLSGVLLESAVLLGFSILFAAIGIWKLNKME